MMTGHARENSAQMRRIQLRTSSRGVIVVSWTSAPVSVWVPKLMTHLCSCSRDGVGRSRNICILRMPGSPAARLPWHAHRRQLVQLRFMSYRLSIANIEIWDRRELAWVEGVHPEPVVPRSSENSLSEPLLLS